MNCSSKFVMYNFEKKGNFEDSTNAGNILEEQY